MTEFDQADARMARNGVARRRARRSDRLARGGLDYVRGDLTSLDLPMPRVPPLRGLAGLHLRKNAFEAGIDGTFTAKQDRVYALGFSGTTIGETPTDGYNVAKDLCVVYVRHRHDGEHDHGAARQRDQRAVPQPSELPEGSRAGDGTELRGRLQRALLSRGLRAGDCGLDRSPSPQSLVPTSSQLSPWLVLPVRRRA